jgi:hypothetical protein
MLFFFLLADRPGCRVAGGERRMDRACDCGIHIQPKARVTPRADFFIWIRCNPLKSPESAKGIQGNPRTFPWIYLDFLAFICMEVAFRL